MKNKNLLVIMIFFVVLFNSIVYSALNSSMFINGDAHIRVDKDIRITDLKVIEQLNGAYETYNSDYSKDTISINVTLPNINSTIVYEITITNKSNSDYEVSEIIEETYSNINIKYEIINLKKSDIITENTTYKFKIKLTTISNENNQTIINLKYIFKEVKNYWDFAYTGAIQVFNVPYNGKYLLEVWGSQGGTNAVKNAEAGVGGYSSGMVLLENVDKLYIGIGSKAGYNGGGKGAPNGGGATHIALNNDLQELYNYSNNIENILIVAGGGGAEDASSYSSGIIGGSGGGFIGTSSLFTPGHGGTQTQGGTGYGNGSFGRGGNSYSGSDPGGGGGGGFYGGGSGGNAHWSSGGGGSGYIGNTLLTDKVMYCYNCNESSDTSTKTISTTNISEEPVSKYAKRGNGHAKITLIEKSK